MDYNTRQLVLIHARLLSILVLLRDNPADASNPELYHQVKELLSQTEVELGELEDR